jgi:hypothetical protein
MERYKKMKSGHHGRSSFSFALSFFTIIYDKSQSASLQTIRIG